MAQGLTAELGTAALVAAVASFAIAVRRLPCPLAIALVALRVGIPLVYFGWYFDGAWTLLDDHKYRDVGLDLFDRGMQPWDIFVDPDAIGRIESLSGSRHFLYFWWNLTATWLLGEEYYVPVFLNVIVTFLTAHVLAAMLQQAGFGQPYRGLVHVFWLVHWDMLAWASLVNVKDPLVQLLTVASLASVVQFHRTRGLRPLAAFVLLSLVLLTIRFYVPVLVLAAVGGWLLCSSPGAVKFLLVPAAAALAVLLALQNAGYMRFIQLDAIGYGAMAFSLQPRPWALERTYSFLAVPALLHWAFFLPMLAGAVVLWRDSKTARLVLIYLVLLVAFYAVVEELQGPRHRLQASFILAWAQAHFLWCCFFRWQRAPAAAAVGIRAPAAARSRPLLPDPVPR